MLVAPKALEEVMESTPAMVENCFFERQGDGRGHGLGTGARKRCRYLNGGKIDIGQIAHGQKADKQRRQTAKSPP